VWWESFCGCGSLNAQHSALNCSGHSRHEFDDFLGGVGHRAAGDEGEAGGIEGGFAARKDEIEAAQLKASGWDDETAAKKLAIELNQGRAAQMGILALMVHEKLDNNPYIINSLLGYPVAFN
jgi:hypothetical protein